MHEPANTRRVVCKLRHAWLDDVMQYRAFADRYFAEEGFRLRNYGYDSMKYCLVLRMTYVRYKWHRVRTLAPLKWFTASYSTSCHATCGTTSSATGYAVHPVVCYVVWSGCTRSVVLKLDARVTPCMYAIATPKTHIMLWLQTDWMAEKDWRHAMRP